MRGTLCRRGNLRVVPGSHHDQRVGSQRSEHYKPSIQQNGEFIPEAVVTSDELSVGPEGAKRVPLEVEVPAGTAVLFDANLLHAVRPNDAIDSQPSERVAFHYIPGDLDTGFRGTSFARCTFADRYLVVGAAESKETKRRRREW